MSDKYFTYEPNYSVLAHIYDTLMHDVNYEAWADYIDELIQMHHPGAEKILELACGTGSVALSLDELVCYEITATDLSAQMINKAMEKASQAGSSVSFKTMDFLEIDLDEKFDVVFMIFDSLNYLHTKEEIIKLHEQVSTVLKPGVFFIYDFTTPRNSRQSIRYLHNEEGVSPDHFRYYRTSDFNPGNNIHVNEFEIEKLDSKNKQVLKRYVEVHKQKIYTFKQMLDLVSQTDFTLIESYDGFRLKKAHSKSLRITMVLQWQKTQS